MTIVVRELLVLPILSDTRERWLELSTASRQRARDAAARQRLNASTINAREEHAMPPPWLANPVRLLVLGLDDGPNKPSFCGDIYLKRRLFVRNAPERRYERGLGREHLLHWAETGRFDDVEDVFTDCEDRVRRHEVPHGRQKRRPLARAVLGRSPLLDAISWNVVVRRLTSRS